MLPVKTIFLQKKFYNKKIKIMKSKIILIATFILSLNVFHTSAQSSSTDQIGLRLGGFSGFNFRHITESNFGIDISILGNVPHDWTLVSLLAEKHFPLGQNFVFYGGIGGYFSYAFDYHDKKHLFEAHSQVGLEGIIGLDYYIANTPINIGIDIRPRFNYLVYRYPWDGGITFRYVF